MPPGLFEFMTSPAGAATVGYGMDFLLGDNTPQGGPVNVGNMGGAYGQMMTTVGQGMLPLWQDIIGQGAPTFNQDRYKADTKNVYQMMEELMAGDRHRARQEQEAKLFAQGRLGSTGGALEQEALESAISDQQIKNMLSAMTQAQGLQSQEYNQWANALGLLGSQNMGLFSKIAPYKNFQKGWGKFNPESGEYDIWSGDAFTKKAEPESPAVPFNYDPSKPPGMSQGAWN